MRIAIRSPIRSPDQRSASGFVVWREPRHVCRRAPEALRLSGLLAAVIRPSRTTTNAPNTAPILAFHYSRITRPKSREGICRRFKCCAALPVTCRYQSSGSTQPS